MSRLRRASSLRRARASSGDGSLLRATSTAPVFVSGSEHAVPRLDIAVVHTTNNIGSSSSSSSSSGSSSVVKMLPRASSSGARSARLRALLRKVSAPIITSPGRCEGGTDAITAVSKQGSPRRTKSPRQPKTPRSRSNSLSHVMEHFKTSAPHTIVIYCADKDDMLIAGAAPAFLIVDDKCIDDDMRAALDRAFDCQFAATHLDAGEVPLVGDETAIKAEAAHLCDANARLPQGAAYAHRRLRDEASGASRREKERTHKRLLAAHGLLGKTRVKEGHVRPLVKHLNVSHIYFFTHP